MWVPVAEVLKEGAEGRKAMRQEHGWHFQGIAGKTMWLEWAGRERENTRRQSGGGRARLQVPFMAPSPPTCSVCVCLVEPCPPKAAWTS